MDFEIAGKKYSPQRNEGVLVIAELGTGHQGSLTKARALVDAAGEAGATCVKFQLVYADEILHPLTGEVPLPGGNIRLYDRFKQLEVSLDFFKEIKSYVEKLGLLFLCTPFGLRSARELRSLDVRAMKIASPELNFTGLLETVASYALPTLLSSGVSKLGDIEAALEILNPRQTCLLHCVTAYPAPEKDYNLRLLPLLSTIFGVSVGVSDHSRDPILVPSLAVAQGACVVEKHFCLSRTDPGLDDPIALNPEDFKVMVEGIRRSSEGSPEETLVYLSKTYGESKIESILGSGQKKLAPSEKENYERTNRSIHALRDLAEGEILREGDFAVYRTEKELRPGLAPLWEKKIVGRRVRNPIGAGEGIRFDDI